MAVTGPEAEPYLPALSVRRRSRLSAGVAELFPPCPSLPARWPLAACCLLVGGTVAVLLRQGGAGALDTVYAEDGTIFLGQAVRTTARDALTRPYVGYFHGLPRLIAEVAAALPLHLAAEVFAVTSATVVAVLALVVFRATAGHIRSVGLRVLVAASLVLLPTAQEEVYNNIANLHWFLIFAAAWVVLWDPPSRWEQSIGCLVVLFSGLSDPLTVLLGPIVVLRVVTQRDWRRQLIPAAFAAGMSLQLLGVMLTDARREGLAPTLDLIRTPGLYVFHVVGRGVFGARLLPDAGRSPAHLLAATALLVIVGALIVRVRRGRPALVIAFLWLSVAYFGTVVSLTGNSPPRYTVVPIWLLISAIACGLGDVSWRSARPLAAAPVLLLVFVVAVWAGNYRQPNRRATSPRWNRELIRASSACDEASLARVRVPIAPPGWSVVLPCDQLSGSARPAE